MPFTTIEDRNGVEREVEFDVEHERAEPSVGCGATTIAINIRYVDTGEDIPRDVLHANILHLDAEAERAWDNEQSDAEDLRADHVIEMRKERKRLRRLGDL
jgi:hypothetical protein